MQNKKQGIQSLIIGISGVRGIVGETLTPELLTRLGAAFGTYMDGGTVVVGRDTRTSGPMIKHSVLGGLLSTGTKIIDIDICSTPTCQIMIEELHADGGIVISGSHNPAEWNALKFFRSDGIYLNDEQGKSLLNIYYQGDFQKARWNEMTEIIRDNTGVDKHINKVLELVDVDKIRSKKFKVVIDCCNGAGSIITPQFLQKLGCELVMIHCEPTGYFPHNPEPTFINLGDLSNKTLESGADIGFAQDADADRVAIISEKGEVLGEEYSLALCTKFVLQKEKGGTVVTNLSTSRAIDDIAKEYGATVIRTPVGEVNVAEKMKKISAKIGGEGNGGVIYPDLHYARDSFIGMALVLQYMAESGKKISDLANGIPKYYIQKNKIECSRGDAYRVLEKLKAKYANEKVNTDDGLKIDLSDSWIHLRRSNTEPIIRIITESSSKKKALDLNNSVLVEIEELSKE
jgi:phosphomannomutase